MFNHTLQKEKEKKTEIKVKNNDNITENVDNNLLNENINNNSAININNHPNINSNFDMTHSSQINQRSESMKNLISNNNEISNNNKPNNYQKKGINTTSTKRPKSSNVFKRTKEVNKNNEMKRNISGKNGKNIKSLKYNINEILERRGIAKTNRSKDFKGGVKYNINGNYVFNSANINNSNRNKPYYK